MSLSVLIVDVVKMDSGGEAVQPAGQAAEQLTAAACWCMCSARHDSHGRWLHGTSCKQAPSDRSYVVLASAISRKTVRRSVVRATVCSSLVVVVVVVVVCECRRCVAPSHLTPLPSLLLLLLGHGCIVLS